MDWQFLLIIFLYFVAIILAFRVLRFLFYFIRYLLLSRKYRAQYDRETRTIMKKNKYVRKSDEIRARNAIAEREMVEANRKLHEGMDVVDTGQETEIVGIAKPQGIWTKFVTGQKMGWLSAMVGSKTENNKFWQNMMKAQQRAQGKQKGRQRGA